MMSKSSLIVYLATHSRAKEEHYAGIRPDANSIGEELNVVFNSPYGNLGLYYKTMRVPAKLLSHDKVCRAKCIIYWF